MDVARGSVSRCGIVVRGPLGPYGFGWREYMIDRGYARRTVVGQMSLMRHLSEWMQARGLVAAELTAPVLGQFLDDRRRQGCRHHVSLRALRPLLGYLSGLHVVPDHKSRCPVTPMERLLDEYRCYLANERRLAPGTVRQYADRAQMVLDDLAGQGGTGVLNLTSGQVTDFVVRYSVGRNAGSAKVMVTALRSLLRFLHITGRVSVPLVSAVPCVPSWSLSSLPRGLDNMQVAALLATCDRESAKGRRDYAILMLLARLGLRATEVGRLTLDDVDWRLGELVIDGKGRRVERLPLPPDVGEALADYVRHGRPGRGSRTLFLTVRAPWTGLERHAVCAVVAVAGRRAGLGRVGAHRLRHAVACELLRRGASLAEIGQLLRHRSQRTTAIYAKVDQDALGGLARQWPQGQTS